MSERHEDLCDIPRILAKQIVVTLRSASEVSSGTKALARIAY